ncbi:hypothetical protein M758_7G000300, partial [Ceratodon purpureus]
VELKRVRERERERERVEEGVIHGRGREESKTDIAWADRQSRDRQERKENNRGRVDCCGGWNAGRLSTKHPERQNGDIVGPAATTPQSRMLLNRAAPLKRMLDRPYTRPGHVPLCTHSSCEI